MPNIEIKANLKNYHLAKKICEEHYKKGHKVEKQIDTYFTTKNGLLKYREIESSTGCTSYLIPYIRQIQGTPKESSYTFLIPTDKNLAKHLLSEVLGAETVVEKTREIYFYKNVRIHLDFVENLGHFIEFEAVYNETDDKEVEKKNVIHLMKVFGVNDEELVKNSYYDLMV